MKLRDGMRRFRSEHQGINSKEDVIKFIGKFKKNLKKRNKLEKKQDRRSHRMQAMKKIGKNFKTAVYNPSLTDQNKT